MLLAGSKFECRIAVAPRLAQVLQVKSPCRKGRGRTAFGKQYHLADVSADIIISEVIGAIWCAPKGQLGQRYLHAIFKQMGYGRILL